MPKTTTQYANTDITVVWQPDKCIHSKICWTNLREVFDPAKRPWVNIEGASTETIMAQVKKCPSGALSFFKNQKEEQAGSQTGEEAESTAENRTKIEIRPNGPIIIHTDCAINYSDGRLENRSGVTALCRCGHSANKPFCDGSHRKHNFQG